MDVEPREWLFSPGSPTWKTPVTGAQDPTSGGRFLILAPEELQGASRKVARFSSTLEGMELRWFGTRRAVILAGFVAAAGCGTGSANGLPAASERSSTLEATELRTELRGRMAEAQEMLERWRGLRFLRPVQLQFIPAEGHGQLGGWYETGTDRLVVVEGRSAAFSRAVLLHELHHALQDQHFGLTGLYRSAHAGDETQALRALVEGEAMLAVTDLLNYDFERHMGLPETGTVDRSLFDKIYEYGSGRRFVLALRERGGWDAVDAAYSQPPRSTAEILHPERYPLTTAEALDLEADSDWLGDSISQNGRRGELELRWLLTAYPPSRQQANAVAAALESDRAGKLRPTTQSGSEAFEADESETEIWQLRFMDETSAQRFEALGAAQAQGWTLDRIGRGVRMKRESAPAAPPADQN